MLIARYTRPYEDEGIPADYFELTAVVSEGQEIMNAEKHFSSKIYIIRFEISTTKSKAVIE